MVGWRCSSSVRGFQLMPRGSGCSATAKWLVLKSFAETYLTTSTFKATAEILAGPAKPTNLLIYSQTEHSTICLKSLLCFELRDTIHERLLISSLPAHTLL